MQIHIIAVGNKAPEWLQIGINEYISRMPKECSVNITTVTAAKRTKNRSISKSQQLEEKLLLKVSPKRCYRIALDEKGVTLSSVKLAENLKLWMQSMPVVTIFIGGPDGFTRRFLEQVDLVWSLSALTMPHLIVRLVLVEQIYRAWTVTQGHPYHRQ